MPFFQSVTVRSSPPTPWKGFQSSARVGASRVISKLVFTSTTFSHAPVLELPNPTLAARLSATKAKQDEHLLSRQGSCSLPPCVATEVLLQRELLFSAPLIRPKAIATLAPRRFS